MVLDIIYQNRDHFSIKEIHEEKYLDDCFKTSYSWTDSPNSLCLSLSKKYFKQAIQNDNIKGIIATSRAVILKKPFIKAVVLSEKADELFYYIHNKKLHENYFLSDFSADESQIDSSAKIAKSAILGKKVCVGENVIIHDGCIILDNTTIKKNTVIYQNVTIGGDGKFTKTILGKREHLMQFGGVAIGENCVILAGSNIVRSVNFGEVTSIGDHVHIGPQSSIGHDCSIGNDCDISARVLVSGRTRIGSNCWIGAGAILSNTINIGKNARVLIGSVVIENVLPGEEVSGNFAIKHKKNLQNYLKFKLNGS